MKKIRRLSVLNLISFLVHLLFSILTQLKAFNDKDVGAVSDQFPSLFTPAGFTFTIWSLIYFALIGFCLYHIRMAYTHEEPHPANWQIKTTGSLFIINNLATAAWLVAWVHEQLFVSVLLILVQLVTLIAMHLRLGIHDASASLGEKLFTQLPLSIYLGWISIATIANVSTWLTANKWSGWGMSPINWAITMIAVTVLLTVAVINRKKNVFFGLVIIWGLYGILRKRMDTDPLTYEPLIKLILGAIAIIALASLFGFIRNLRHHRETL